MIGEPAFTSIHDHLGVIKPYLPEPVPLESTSRSHWRASDLPWWDSPAEFPVAKPSFRPGIKHRWLPLGISQTEIGRTRMGEGGWKNYKAKWESWAVAAQEHYSFLEHMEQMRLERYFFQDRPYDLPRKSPNLIAVWGDDVVDNGPVPNDEDKYLTSTLPKKLGKGKTSHHPLDSWDG
ncbi:MAG: hypothetical protein Q9163_004444 [Psora crenata]